MPLPDPSDVARELPARMRPVIAPLRKVPFGLGVGTMAGFWLAAATLALVIHGGENVGDAMGRLSHVYPGYDVDGRGVLLGFGYGFVTGFVVGWATAFFRNLVLSIYVFLVSARERARASGSVLDDLS